MTRVPELELAHKIRSHTKDDIEALKLLTEYREQIKTTTLRTLLEADVVRLNNAKKSVRDLHPDASLNPLDEDTAFFVTEKNGYNQAIEAEITHTQQLLDELNAM